MVTQAKSPAFNDEFRSTLEQVLSQHYGSPQRIRRLRRSLSNYSSSCVLENLDVLLDRRQPLRLVFKNLSPASLLSPAQKVRPPFLYHPRREIEIYRRLLDPAQLGTPLYYGSVVSERLERYWLFLERVPGPLLWQVGSMKSWQQAARWLARLHTAFNATKRLPNRQRQYHLLVYDADFYRAWLKRADQFLRDKGGRIARANYRRFSALASRYDRVVNRLNELPKTFIHGEFFPSNIIRRRTRKGPQICPIDWELAALAPGLIDLGALTTGEWSADDRNKMIAVYREHYEPVQGPAPSLPELIEAVEWCQLHLCMQFLGWASDWSPPELQAQNWLRELFRLAARVGL